MRAIIVSLVLIVISALQAAGLEVEQTKMFPAREDSAEELRILSTTDLENFAPMIEAFQDQRPDVSVNYTVAASHSPARGPVFAAGRAALGSTCFAAGAATRSGCTARWSPC